MYHYIAIRNISSILVLIIPYSNLRFCSLYIRRVVKYLPYQIISSHTYKLYSFVFIEKTILLISEMHVQSLESFKVRRLADLKISIDFQQESNATNKMQIFFPLYKYIIHDLHNL